MKLLRCNKIEIPRRSYSGMRQRFSLREPMLNFITDNLAEFGVGPLLVFAVANTARIPIRTVADVALVFVRPMNKAMVAIFWFHRWDGDVEMGGLRNTQKTRKGVANDEGSGHFGAGLCASVDLLGIYLGHPYFRVFCVF